MNKWIFYGGIVVYIIVLLFFGIYCFYIYRYYGYSIVIGIVIFMVIDYKFMKVGWFVIL